MGYKMGRYKDITSVKTIKKVEIAKKYYEEGFSVNEIAEKMALSLSLIHI